MLQAAGARVVPIQYDLPKAELSRRYVCTLWAFLHGSLVAAAASSSTDSSRGSFDGS